MTHLKRLGALSLSLALTLTALSGCQNGASSSSQGMSPSTWPRSPTPT